MGDQARPEHRRKAEQRAEREERGWRVMLLVGAALMTFAVYLVTSDADVLMWAATGLFGIGIVFAGLLSRRRRQLLLRIARQGQLAMATVYEIHRKPGDQAPINEYSLHVGVSVDGQTLVDSWNRAILPPPDAERLFGQLPPVGVAIVPEDTTVPVLILPDETTTAVLAF